MTFVPNADIYLGPRSFGARKGTVGIIWHTTEATGFTRAAAVGTANWQKTNPGSYNWIIYDGGLLLTVPYLEASGGVNPASASWAPERFPWLKTMLPFAAYADPNAYQLNVAFSGRTADILAGRMPPNMYETAARLTKWVEEQAWGADNLVFSGHLHWQSNRSDPGQPTIDRILSDYARLFTAPTPAPPPDYQALYVAEQAKVSDLSTKLAAERSKVTSLTTQVSGLTARINNAKVALG
jgi:hypothetical protein